MRVPRAKLIVGPADTRIRATEDGHEQPAASPDAVKLGAARHDSVVGPHFTIAPNTDKCTPRKLVPANVPAPSVGTCRKVANYGAFLTMAVQTKTGRTFNVFGPSLLVAGARNPLNLEFAWAAA
jgi:hypothetical protein